MTHAHRDHIGGLLQVINQRGEAGAFALGHPAQGRTWNQLEAFALKFKPRATSHSAIWRGARRRRLDRKRRRGAPLALFRTKHYADDNPTDAPRSLGYHLIWRKMKVKPEYRDLSQAELDAVRLRIGKEGITAPVDEKIVTVSGGRLPLRPEAVAAHNCSCTKRHFKSRRLRCRGRGRGCWPRALDRR